MERACAILATRVAGLRHAADLGLPHGEAAQGLAQGPGEAPAWEGQRFADRDGRDWQVLNVGALLDAPAFLQVGRSAA
ncbi:hypothetical protein D9M68_843800 [compost metagenome]